jgi:hypothetical protein
MKVVVVELKRMLVEKKVEKEGVGGRPATHFDRPAKPWPPLSPNFLHPAHLVPLMLKPLTKTIESKVISFDSFPKFHLFYFIKFFDFMTCNDGKQKYAMKKE